MNAFTKYKIDGANAVRVWIFFNGDKSFQLYDSSGHFKALPNKFYDDLKYVLDLAKSNSLKIHFTLFSFECVNINNCRSMITDSSKSESFINNGLKPILSFIKNGYSD